MKLNYKDNSLKAESVQAQGMQLKPCQSDSKKNNKQALWICPKCSTECFEISLCSNCQNADLYYAVIEFAKMKQKRDFKDSFTSGATTAFCFLVFLGLPIYVAAFQVFASWQPINEVTVRPPQILSPQGEVSPTPEIIPNEIRQAIDSYLKGTWNGWEFKGYDEETVSNLDDEITLSIYVEKQNRTAKVDLKIQKLKSADENKFVWEVLPDTGNYQITKDDLDDGN